MGLHITEKHLRTIKIQFLQRQIISLFADVRKLQHRNCCQCFLRLGALLALLERFSRLDDLLDFLYRHRCLFRSQLFFLLGLTFSSHRRTRAERQQNRMGILQEILADEFLKITIIQSILQLHQYLFIVQAFLRAAPIKPSLHRPDAINKPFRCRTKI